MAFCIHIIDDDAGVRESLKALLVDSGYSVRCYAGAESFLEDSRGAGGCALVDLKLGDMDGLALQQRLLAENSSLDIIMMSAYGNISEAVTAMRRGAVDFLEKPFTPEHMLARIRSLYEIRHDDDTARRNARRNAALVESLTPRERQVLGMVVDGLANKEIARGLAISSRTVETHRVHIINKLKADSLPHLVRIWIAAGHDLETPALQQTNDTAVGHRPPGRVQTPGDER